MEKISYSLGLSIAANLLKSGVTNLDFEAFTRGVKHFLEGEKTEISTEEAGKIINEYFSKLQSKQFEANIKAGQEFLEEKGLKG